MDLLCFRFRCVVFLVRFCSGLSGPRFVKISAQLMSIMFGSVDGSVDRTVNRAVDRSMEPELLVPVCRLGHGNLAGDLFAMDTYLRLRRGVRICGHRWVALARRPSSIFVGCIRKRCHCFHFSALVLTRQFFFQQKSYHLTIFPTSLVGCFGMV